MQKRFRGFLAMVLTLTLLLEPALPVWATETLPEETQTETTAPEETEVPETTAATEATDVPETTAATEETEVPETTAASEEAIIPEETEEPAAPLLTVAEVLAMEAGSTGIRMTGTVVFAAGTQAILQDETGGIRLSFVTVPEIQTGDILLASGSRSGGFLVESFEKTGTGTMPAVESRLAEDRSNQRILVKHATLGPNSLCQDDCSYSLKGRRLEGLKIGDPVDVWGVLIDGVFYADTILPAAAPTEVKAATTSGLGGWNFYFGQLHAHSSVSDGMGTPEEAFAHAYGVENLDFFALTDHSNSFENAASGVIDRDGSAISAEWAAGKAAAAAVTDETFVGIFAYEMTWQEDLAIGHISSFGTPGWQTREQPGMNTLNGYLDALALAPNAVSQFNHPGPFYGDFYNFSRYDPQYDQRMHLLEVGGEGNFTAYKYYTKALDKGWHLAPSNNQNNHNGNWGTENSHRTVVLAEQLSEEAIYDAIRNYRVYATEDADLKILYTLNGALMGSTIGETPNLTVEVWLEDPTDEAIGLVEVVTNGGAVAASGDGASGEISLTVPAGGSYYYLRITQPDGDVAVTAPVWLESYENLGVESFAAQNPKPDVGTETQLILTLYNQETVPFQVETVKFTAGDQILATVLEPGRVAPMGTLEIPVTCTGTQPGAMTVSVKITGTIAGSARTYEASQTIHWQALEAPLLTIAEARALNPGESCRIRGYVTAGTSKQQNSFPNSIYLQDDTGGIQILDFTEPGIQLGAPMEVEGILLMRGGNHMLALTDYEIRKEAYYRYDPSVMSNKTAMDYVANGGELMKIEGSVVSVTKTADGKGVSRFTLRDIHGDLATVLVESGIGSGAYGINELASEVQLKRTVRALGLVHTDEFGQTVLRVRNCDEVVYVPPRKDPTNPKTGDWLAILRFWN